MGKKSIRENKNVYQLAREEQGLTREKAAELLEFISDDRIEKIESEKSYPHPDEIVVMAKAYKKPALRNYYCTHECPIGQKHVPELQLKDLSQIVLEILNSLNLVEKEKSNFINITVDGAITEDEYEDFAKIQDQLDQVAVSVRSLQLWLEQTIANGDIDAEALKVAKSKLK